MVSYTLGFVKKGIYIYTVTFYYMLVEEKNFKKPCFLVSFSPLSSHVLLHPSKPPPPIELLLSFMFHLEICTDVFAGPYPIHSGGDIQPPALEWPRWKRGRIGDDKSAKQKAIAC